MSFAVCQVQQQETQNDYSLNDIPIAGYSPWGNVGGRDIPKHYQARKFRYPAWLKKLAWALLSQSIIDVKNTGKSNNARRAKEEAVDWLHASDNWLFSYKSVCGILGVDPEKTQAIIMNPNFEYRAYRIMK